MTTPVVIAEATAASILTRMPSGRAGTGGTIHIRAFESKFGRHLAIVPGLKSIRAFTEPVLDRVPATLAHLHFRSYPENKTRNHHLKQHAPRLAQGRNADYWLFPTVGDFESFARWYAHLAI
ncbi:hypothetical protein [Stenotrophomonas sp.]|uniref:hypothetical protein n=1 Tax=Stenotrophomonas sp. TaxID=69392 RepID=UPI0031E42A80